MMGQNLAQNLAQLSNFLQEKLRSLQGPPGPPQAAPTAPLLTLLAYSSDILLPLGLHSGHSLYLEGSFSRNPLG